MQVRQVQKSDRPLLDPGRARGTARHHTASACGAFERLRGGRFEDVRDPGEEVGRRIAEHRFSAPIHNKGRRGRGEELGGRREVHLDEPEVSHRGLRLKVDEDRHAALRAEPLHHPEEQRGLAATGLPRDEELGVVIEEQRRLDLLSKVLVRLGHVRGARSVGRVGVGAVDRVEDPRQLAKLFQRDGHVSSSVHRPGVARRWASRTVPQRLRARQAIEPRPRVARADKRRNGATVRLPVAPKRARTGRI